MFKTLFENISPQKFYYFSSKIIPWAFLISFLFIGYGLYLGLFVAPLDYQQGDAFRIIYVHVPSAWLSLFAYSAVFVCSIIALIWKIKVFEILTIASAKNGALFTFLALITGSIWGKPMWGTWWVWDARLTSMVVLLFFYILFISAQKMIKDKDKANKISGLVAIVGLINIPIIKYSVDWWSTLHQPQSINLLNGSSSIHSSMLMPLILMLFVLLSYCALIFLMKYKTEIIRIKKKNLKRL